MLQGLQELWGKRRWICVCSKKKEGCWVYGGGPRGKTVSNKREANRKQQSIVYVVGGAGGGAKSWGGGHEVTLLFQLAESGYSVNILINMQLFPWVFFLFFLEKWCTNMLEDNSHASCIWHWLGFPTKKPQTTSLNLPSGFTGWFSGCLFPHLLPFPTTGSYKARYYLFICVTLLSGGQLTILGFTSFSTI